MCPLRIILVFLSATLAGYFAWRTVRSPAPSPFDDGASREAAPENPEPFDLEKAIVKGFWLFVDMASGRYLWRNIGAAAAAASAEVKDR